MTETPTPHAEPTNSTFDRDIDDALFLANARTIAGTSMGIQPNSEARDHTPEANSPQGKKVLTKIAGGALALAAAAGVGTALGQIDSAPIERSTETTTITVENGDGLQSIAAQVPGSEKYDIRDVTDSIATDPANIDVLKDGLQPGESVTVPIEFK